MSPEAIEGFTALIIQGGAIVVLVWVVSMIVSGKLHTESEVEGLRQDKTDLLAVNKNLSDALATTNELLRVAIRRES